MGNTRPAPRLLLLLPAEQLLRCQNELSPQTLFQNTSEGRAGEFKKLSLSALWCVSSGLFSVECHGAVITSSAAHIAAFECSPCEANGLKYSPFTCQALNSERADQVSSKESQPLACFHTDNWNKFPLRPEQLVFFSRPVTVIPLAVGEELQCRGRDTKLSLRTL